jgi:hypothetical protein
MAFQLSNAGAKDFDISSPLLEQTFKLSKDSSGSCFTDSTHLRVNLCFYSNTFTVEISDTKGQPQYSVVLNKFAVVKPPTPEVPQEYTLQQAVQKAWQQNFDNRIEFQHVTQARAGAQVAKKNLLPHVSFGTIVNLLTPSFLGVLQSAGDLLPFLFPSRWIEAKKAQHMDEAELDTLNLLRLDTAVQIEALFYNYENDRQIHDLYSSTIEKAKAIQRDVAFREKLAFANYPPGSTDIVTVPINLLEESFIPMEALVNEDKAAIAQAMGLVNSQGVTDAKLGIEVLPIERAQPLNVDDVTKVAIARSVELRQLDFLIQAADNNTSGVYWNWLDPTGDPTMNLGLNLKGNVEIAKSQKIELQINKEKMVQGLGQKAEAAVEDYNSSIKLYAKSLAAIETENRILAKVHSDLVINGKIDFGGLEQDYQDLLTATVSAQNALFTFRCARARIDRLQLQGYYVKATIPTEKK